MQFNWAQLFIAALHTLTALSPAVIAQFGGGAAKTASKVGSALVIADTFTTQLSQGMTPTVPEDVHPDLAAHAASIAVAEKDAASGG